MKKLSVERSQKLYELQEKFEAKVMQAVDKMFDAGYDGSIDKITKKTLKSRELLTATIALYEPILNLLNEESKKEEKKNEQ